ncbi:hypothetical protein PY310_20090 [Pseudarthrobacter sp. H3Y2-7]|uniref:hypothetical protein n=1 Tax=Pseudarthrobacter naphthalenicus TaxID=3031328 RepID=UPI0023AF70D6|nr:hypothetical protein [Pseudarthrobacter sp. H3Y2-7]MDE8670875.1 hypothetical protein [Pseudarthrobacter sp. H3Y2-7]
MGYTHDFPGLKATPAVIEDARRLIAASAVTICGPNGQGLPVSTEKQGIRLNGDKAVGESYDTFHLRGTDMPRYPAVPDFCKTENQPYDEVVTAILIAAAVREFESKTGVVKSDGRWDNWAAGLQLYERAIRRLTDEEKLALELDVERMRPDPIHA